MLNTNLQLFAEADPVTEPAPAAEPAPVAAPVTQSATQNSAANVPAPEARTFSADYVHDLREESKGYRQTAKSYEAALRKVLNVADNEDLGNVNKRITELQAAQANAIKSATDAANSKLIAAEIKSLDGYDTKLLAKVMDYGKITVDENGNVNGVKEAAEEAAKEYPAVMKTQPAKYSAGTGQAPVGEKYGKEMLAFMSAAGIKKK